MIASLAGLLLAAPAPAYDAATAEICRTTPWEQLDHGLQDPCSSFGVLLVDHLAHSLTTDDRAFALLCEGPGTEAARADIDIDLGCLLAEGERSDAAVTALLTDLAALEPRCAGPVDADRDPILATACANRTKARLSGEIARLTRDDDAYAEACAAFGDTPVDLSQEGLGDDRVACEHARYRRTVGTDIPAGWTAYAPGDKVVEMTAPAATSSSLADLDALPEPGDGSPFDRAARDAAAAIIAEARAGQD